MISTSGIVRRTESSAQATFSPFDFSFAQNSAQPYEPSVRTRTPLSAHAETEDKKLRKDPLEVLALKVPFGRQLVKPLLSE